jgi:hypothetical protein
MAGRGPLPSPDAIRRNAPTIPTTSLPASGRKGVAPAPPFGLDLAAEGAAWWSWAWSTPQAAGWSVGDEYLLARRASLEDDIAALAAVEGLDCGNFEGADDELRKLIQRIAALATGRLQIMREMREIDDRLGLTPKGLAALRWKIVDDTPKDEQGGGSTPTTPRTGKQYGHLRSA